MITEKDRASLDALPIRSLLEVLDDQSGKKIGCRPSTFIIGFKFPELTPTELAGYVADRITLADRRNKMKPAVSAEIQLRTQEGDVTVFIDPSGEVKISAGRTMLTDDLFVLTAFATLAKVTNLLAKPDDA